MDDIEKNYRVIILRENENGNDYVTRAAYQPDKDVYIIYYSPVAFDNIEKGFDKEEIISQTKAALVHEYVHRQQNQLNQKKQPIIRCKDNYDNYDNYDDYISQKHEIDAYAAGIAYEWVLKIGEQEAINKLRLNDFSDLSDDTQYLIKDYHKLGGKIYKRLLVEIYTRLFHEPSTYSTDKLGLRATLKRNAEKLK